MPKLKFNTSINAPKEKVWNALWDDKNYREWTSVFSPDSHAVSDWKEGSKIQFLDGKGNGMYSIIQKRTENEEMIFRHLGEIKDGKETPGQWGDSNESYFLKETNGKTELKTELDAPDDFVKYFEEVFPKALALVKQIAER
jgi:uncharacterized protein YndB with AHSA1/START domain